MKILIVGDSCIDEFVYGSIFRMSPEAPAPVFNPLRKKINGGMSNKIYIRLY